MTLPDRIVAPRRSRLRVRLGAAVVLVLVGLGVAVLVTALGPHGAIRVLELGGDGSVSNTVVGASDEAAGSPASASDSATGNAVADTGGVASGSTGADDAASGSPGAASVFIHLLGAVARPGLYELRQGDRAVDVIAAAGGFSDNADQGGLNLARVLIDGEQIYVPVVGETPPPAPALGPGIVSVKVNLNTADEAALDTLPGVGPATAKRILDWRQTNGPFTAIEDLLSVSGIGDKTFTDLKDLVTV